MSEIVLLLIGGLIALTSSVITQIVSHFLTNKRERVKWERDEIRRKQEKVLELENKLKEKDVYYHDLLLQTIILLNQRRDALLGFNQVEQNRRMTEIEEMLKNKSEEELEAIAREEVPLPELPGKPQSLR